MIFQFIWNLFPESQNHTGDSLKVDKKSTPEPNLLLPASTSQECIICKISELVFKKYDDDQDEDDDHDDGDDDDNDIHDDKEEQKS